jgi:hypothetical protein
MSEWANTRLTLLLLLLLLLLLVAAAEVWVCPAAAA